MTTSMVLISFPCRVELKVGLESDESCSACRGPSPDSTGPIRSTLVEARE